MIKVSSVITNKIHQYRARVKWTNNKISSYLNNQKPFGPFCIALYAAKGYELIGRHTLRHFYIINLNLKQIIKVTNYL